MNNKTISYFLIIGVLISLLCAHTNSDRSAISDPINSDLNKSGNDTTISEYVHEENSLKQFSREDVLFSDLKPGPANVSKRFSFGTENEGSSKPQKVKKKILISNLKSGTEKAVLPNDKYDKQSYLKTSLNGSGYEDEMRSKSSIKIENNIKDPTVSSEKEVEPVAEKINATEMGKSAKHGENGTNSDDSFKNDTLDLEFEKDLSFVPNEPRNFEVSDRKKKNNSNFKISNRKNKVTTSTTENYGKVTTNSYMYITLQEVQKAVNNNYLNVNEDFEKNSQTLLVTSNTPVLRVTVASPEGKPDSISNGNTVKNLVRLENNYYGPTDQTDWIPVMPIKRLESEKQLESHSTLSKSIDLSSNVVLTTTIKPVYPSLMQNTRVISRRKHSTTESNILVPSSSLTTSLSQSPRYQTSAAENMSSTNEPSNTEQSTDIIEGNKLSSNKVTRMQFSSNASDPEINRKVHNDSGQSGILGKFRGYTKYRTTTAGISNLLNFTAENNNKLKDNLTSVDSSNKNFMQKIEITSPRNIQSSNAATQSSLSTQMSLTAASKTESSDSLVFGKKLISNAISVGIERATPKISNETSTPLDVTKPKHIAKIQVLKNTISDKFASDNPISIFKFSETEPPNSTSSMDEDSVAGFTMKYLSTTEVPDTAVNYDSMKLSSVTNESGATNEVTTQTSFLNFAIDSGNTSNGSSEKIQEDDFEIESSVSRDILKVSTPSMRTIGSFNLNQINLTTENSVDAEIFMTTNSGNDEITVTEEESTTAFSSVTEIEKDSLYTDEIMPKTTFKTIIHPDSGAATESSIDETSKEVNFMTSKTILVDVGMTTTEKDKTIFVNTEISGKKSVVTTVKIYPKEEESSAGSLTIRPGTHRIITEENVPAYLKLTVEAASWEELCRLKDDLRNAIIHMLDGMNITSNSVVFLNLNEKNCQEKMEEPKDDRSNLSMFLPVNMFLMNENGDFDKNLSEAFLNLWGQYGLDFELPIRKVDFLTPLGGLYDIPNDTIGVSVIAAIIISCVAGLCVILLGILFVIMKRRQKRFNYGQRCTPVSLDAYSLDSVSIHNSVRRKGIRTSKRSYGNAAFDDPEVPSHPMNFAGLANFSSDKEQLYEEFNIIPQVSPKTDELPTGAERKNRYANVIPLPETRVYLSVKDGDNLSDYINANYVRGLKGAEKLYIACQAPMESTVEDFWRMVWEQQSKVIIMLTNLQENGMEKCTDYLPPNEVTDNLRLFGDFQITLKKRDVKEKYIISHLKLKNMDTNLWREVTHLWYLGWPDQGIPSEGNSLIAFLIEARSQMKSQTGSTVPGPAVIHCSPGTGRTGTVIACDLCIREYEQTRMVDIPKCVFNLRKDRAGSVQTKDQYAFIYQVLNLYATKLTGGGLESI